MYGSNYAVMHFVWIQALNRSNHWATATMYDNTLFYACKSPDPTSDCIVK